MKTADLSPLKDAQFVQHMHTHTLTVKLILGDLWTLQSSFILSLFSWVHVINQLTAVFELPKHSVQFSSVAQSCLTLCDPMNCSTPGLPVHHQLPEFTQTHVHRVSDAIQPSHYLLSHFPPAPNPSQHQSLFQ